MVYKKNGEGGGRGEVLKVPVAFRSFRGVLINAMDEDVKWIPQKASGVQGSVINNITRIDLKVS